MTESTAPEEPLRSSISEYYRAVKVTLSSIVTQDPQMKRVLEQASLAARNDVTILLLGENGTGKNLLAQGIHNASPRAGKTFVSVNCSAITESLLESELFGHEKGAFTGAERTRRGRFELADGGTLFLDEIGDLSSAAQAKILTAVEYKEFQRVGGEKTIRSNVRIIAATNRDLEVMVQENAFREDLYYRLNEVKLAIPPLRERKGDIPLIIEKCLAEQRQKHQTAVEGVSEEVMKCFMSHDWPGNVRELTAALKRGISMAKGKEIRFEDLALRIQYIDTDLGSVENKDELLLNTVERRHIAWVLSLTKRKKNETCKLLGITRPTLDRKIKFYNLEVES
ncbi:MAG: sigma 54-interacting transcriptional regulator [Planctomycetota bacterium]